MRPQYHLYFFCFLLCAACQQPGKVDQYEVQLELDSIIQLMDYDLAVLEREITALGQFSVSLLEQPIDAGVAYTFVNGANNPAPNHNPDHSTLYISRLTPNVREAEKLANITAPLDSAFKSLVQSHEMLSQVYFNSAIQLSRLYPPYDPFALLDPDLDLTSYNFFYEADEKNNPQRKAVWIEEIYIDPAGKGWILTLLYPVYHENKLNFVIGFDVTINDIVEQYFNNTQHQLVIVDNTGMVVAGKSRAIEALSLPPLKNHTYTQTIRSDSFRMEDFNIFKSKSREVREMASKLLLANEKGFKLKESGSEWQVVSRKLNRLNWHFIDVNLQ